MEQVTPNRALMFLVFGIVAYASLALIVDPIILKDIFNNLALGVTVVVAATWAQAAFLSLRKDTRTSDWLVVYAVFLSACTIAFNRLFAIVAISMDRPDWLIDGPIAAFVPYSIALCFSLFLVAPGFVPGTRVRYKSHLIAAGVIAGFVSGVLIGRTIPF